MKQRIIQDNPTEIRLKDLSEENLTYVGLEWTTGSSIKKYYLAQKDDRFAFLNDKGIEFSVGAETRFETIEKAFDWIREYVYRVEFFVFDYEFELIQWLKN